MSPIRIAPLGKRLARSQEDRRTDGGDEAELAGALSQASRIGQPVGGAGAAPPAAGPAPLPGSAASAAGKRPAPRPYSAAAGRPVHRPAGPGSARRTGPGERVPAAAPAKAAPDCGAPGEVRTAGWNGPANPRREPAAAPRSRAASGNELGGDQVRQRCGQTLGGPQPGRGGARVRRDLVLIRPLGAAGQQAQRGRRRGAPAGWAAGRDRARGARRRRGSA